MKNPTTEKPMTPQAAIAAAVRQLTPPPEPAAPVEVQPPPPTIREVVLGDAEITGAVDFFGISAASVEHLTKPLFTDEEIYEIREIQARASRFTKALESAVELTRNPVQLGVELAKESNEPLTPAQIDHVVGAPKRRAIAKAVAKETIRCFYKESVFPILGKIHTRIADHLKGVILARIAKERAAWEKLNADICPTENTFVYSPSQIVLSLVLRRIQLMEPIPPSPCGRHEPAHTLKGILNFAD